MPRCPAILLSLAYLAVFLFSCGGGGSSFGTSAVLEWDPPEYFSDGTPLDPSRDLQAYEVYVRTDASFGPEDLPVATVPPPVTSVPLGNVISPLVKGRTYYLSLRSVSVGGVKSDFTPPLPFSP